MLKTMTQDTKDQIANLEREKIALEDQLEFVGNNLVKMHEIENEIYEIEDTIKKLLSQVYTFVFNKVGNILVQKPISQPIILVVEFLYL